MACGQKRSFVPASNIGVMQNKAAAKAGPIASDFHCADCGLTLLRRPVDFAHLCLPGSYDEGLLYQQERIVACNACEHARDDICAVQKRLYPDRDCSIAIGVKKPDAHCPLQKWHRRSRPCPKCLANIHSVGVPWYCRSCDWVDDAMNDGKAIVTMIVGTQAEELAQYTLPMIRKYATKCNADVLVIDRNTGDDYVLASKFQIHSIAKRYAQTLFVDIDVIVKDNAPNLFTAFPRGAVMHNDSAKLSRIDWFIGNLQDVCQSQNVPLLPIEVWNTGVVVCDRASADIWTPPINTLPRHHLSEQTWVGVNAKRLGIEIQDLPSTMNWQWWFPDFGDNSKNAYCTHLASCPHPERIATLKASATHL
jgi:hypothetical protein